MCTTLFRDCEREGAAKTVYRAYLQGGKVTETPAKRVVSWVEYYPWSLLRLENDKPSSSQALRVALIIGDVKLNAVRIQVFTILVWKWPTSLPKRNVPTVHQCVLSNILEERARGCYFIALNQTCKVHWLISRYIIGKTIRQFVTVIGMRTYQVPRFPMRWKHYIRDL